MIKIMQSGYDYDPKTATQQKSLYYAAYDKIPKIEVGHLSFYELNDLLSISKLSATKKKKLENIKLGKAVQLFNVSRTNYYYAVLLNEKEEDLLENLKKEMSELNKVNHEIETQVGHLLTIQKKHEKNISEIVSSFKKT